MMKICRRICQHSTGSALRHVKKWTSALDDSDDDDDNNDNDNDEDHDNDNNYD